jgi:UDP-GlcNAc3NAcA epimerase
VKAAVVSRRLRARAGWSELIVHTGQHYDGNMSDVFFEEMRIPRPDFMLEVGSSRHGDQTAKMLAGIERILLDVMPDWAIVYGDTNTTLAAALAAAKLHIPIAHIEAGLRSFNRQMPEEINRVLTDHVSELLLAPTSTAVANLRREGIPDNRIRLVGDVMCDAVLFYRGLANQQSQILDRLKLADKQLLLATVHRAENTDDAGRLSSIFRGLIEAAKRLPVVVPLHPRTRQALRQHHLWDAAAKSLMLIEPVGYLDMIRLQSSARLIATDSGGVQKEAFLCRTPCLTLRDETEWVELIELGWNNLLSPSRHADIGAALIAALDRPPPPYPESNPYGRGDSSELIVAAIAENRRIPQAA